MTRYRRQSTLTFLAERLAKTTGEHQRLANRKRRGPTERQRMQQLEAEIQALEQTIRQFDPGLDPSVIAPSTRTSK
ncbi:hypothetical protein [Hydrogenophaga crocea]|uniref:Transposase n=1 Tax=Hydrogenophaga crocea TaxID=2716225 RepID=A0A6G8II00_9BURK|nr:hypothetical protein [Hydrogenophaga crocea]QIM52827.1 hypothetical protein G9Q37_12060 [Hydrogenophaga crocea]